MLSPSPAPKTVAALFVRADSIYKTLPGVDCWDIERDARKWPGGCPVVTHPPCRLWASLRTKSKAPPEEKGHAIWAMEQVRQFGGVLEHPWLSTLWDYFGLRPRRAVWGWAVGEPDGLGGFLLPVDMFVFGYQAKKRTGLYIVGVKPQDPGGYVAGPGCWNDKARMGGKPTLLMDALVGDYSRPGDTVLDSHMGAGTTGVSCARLGRGFIGCEIDPEVFDIACRRIEEAQKQGALFPHETPAAQEQAGLFAEVEA